MRTRGGCRGVEAERVRRGASSIFFPPQLRRSTSTPGDTLFFFPRCWRSTRCPKVCSFPPPPRARSGGATLDFFFLIPGTFRSTSCPSFTPSYRSTSTPGGTLSFSENPRGRPDIRKSSLSLYSSPQRFSFFFFFLVCLFLTYIHVNSVYVYILIGGGRPVLRATLCFFFFFHR